MISNTSKADRALLLPSIEAGSLPCNAQIKFVAFVMTTLALMKLFGYHRLSTCTRHLNALTSIQKHLTPSVAGLRSTLANQQQRDYQPATYRTSLTIVEVLRSGSVSISYTEDIGKSLLQRWSSCDFSPTWAFSTHRTHSMSAKEQALSTIELVELVLKQIDMKSLFRCQSVNKLFNRTIKQSSHFQRALFFQVINKTISVDQEPVMNDLLFPVSARVFHGYRARYRVFCDLSPYGDGRAQAGLWLHINTADLHITSLRDDQGSWKSMLLCQPPCAVYISIYGGSAAIRMRVHGGEGEPLRMGDVPEMARSMLQLCH